MITLYGISNCDTVKKARKWLQQHGIDYRFHDLRSDGINEALVNHWLEQLPLEQLVNRRSTSWKQLDENVRQSLTADNAAALCCQHPTLIKRPLLDNNGSLHSGFSEAGYRTIFLS